MFILPDTAKKVERKVRDWNLSLNRTVLRILGNALHEEDAGIRHHDLDDLAGVWSAEEAREFDEALAEQRRC